MKELIISNKNTIHIESSEKIKEIKLKDKFIKLLGIYQIEETDILLYIKESQNIGEYKKDFLFKIDLVSFYILNNDNLSINILTDMCKFLSNSFFFYSLNKIDNDSFLWNEFSLKVLETKYGINEQICFLYCGYFGKEESSFKYLDKLIQEHDLIKTNKIESEQIKDKMFNSSSSSSLIGEDMTDLQINKEEEKEKEELLNTEMCLLSLISKERIGPRFLCRGIDDNSNVAMFVKTKFNFDYKLNNEHKSFNLKIYRGSIPLFWQQTEDIKKSLYFLREPSTIKTLECFTNHFKNIKNEDQIIFVINLLGNRKTESILTNNYTKLLDSINILYDTFDLNKYQLNYETLKIEFFKFMDRVMNKIEIKYKEENFNRLITNRVVFRVNCLDCLDRTNVAQMLITEYIIKNYNQEGLINSINNEIERIYKKLWAENGNTLSIFYSNTNAHKNELSSKGSRTIFGLIDDMLISASRVVYGNITDKQKDLIIKSLLNIKPIVINQTNKYKEKIGLINYSIYEEIELENPFINVIKNIDSLIKNNNVKYIIISIQILKNYLYTKSINLDNFINYLKLNLELNLVTKKVFKSNIILLLETSGQSDIINIEFDHSNTYDIFNIKYLLRMKFQLKIKESIKTINVYSILVTDFSVFQSLKKRLNEEDINIINITLLGTKNEENSINENLNRITSIHLINDFLIKNIFKEKYIQIECKSNLQNNFTYFNNSIFKERLDVEKQDSRPYLLIIEVDI